MPTPVTIYQTLVSQYDQLPWYKKAGFWLSAPRLAWGLFGYKQNPNKNRIQQLIQWAKISWFFKTKFEEDIYSVVEPASIVGLVVNQESHSNMPRPNTSSVALGGCTDVVGVTTEYKVGKAYAANSLFLRDGDVSKRIRIANQLLLAVAYGMESKDVNEPVSASDVGNLFKFDFYAKELLQKAPEFLLERGNITDWAGRTFNNITAFEYALWAKDFKMIEMMLGCVPETLEGDEIKAELLEQYKHVMSPISAGGGLTYTHTYGWPNLDTAGIPDGTTITVIKEYTENHFDLTKLCDAYQYFISNFDSWTWVQRDAYWSRLIGKLQRLLPVHVLQRFCALNTPFYPLHQFINSGFKRATNFGNLLNDEATSIFGSSLSTDYALIRTRRYKFARASTGIMVTLCVESVGHDLAAVHLLDEVSTNEIKKLCESKVEKRVLPAQIK